jgi:LuxR family maltose regulon positive regulatory protein
MISFLAVIYLMQGRLSAAASLCREFLDSSKAKSLRFISTAGNLEIVLGAVLYEWNRLEEAEQQIRAGLQANEPWHNIMTDAFGLLALIYVLQARGDYAGALQMVEKFEARLQDDFRPYEFNEDFRTLRVRVQLASGDLQHAVDWADQIQRSEDFRLHEEYYRFTLARIRLEQCQYAEVEKLLTGMAPLTLGVNRINRQIESNLFRAAAIAGQGRVEEAVPLIESSLSLAEPEGYIRSFLDVGELARERSHKNCSMPFPSQLRQILNPLD